MEEKSWSPQKESSLDPTRLPLGETPEAEVVLRLRDMHGELITWCLWDCVGKLDVKVQQ